MEQAEAVRRTGPALRIWSFFMCSPPPTPSRTIEDGTQQPAVINTGMRSNPDEKYFIWPNAFLWPGSGGPRGPASRTGQLLSARARCAKDRPQGRLFGGYGTRVGGSLCKEPRISRVVTQ